MGANSQPQSCSRPPLNTGACVSNARLPSLVQSAPTNIGVKLANAQTSTHAEEVTPVVLARAVAWRLCQRGMRSSAYRRAQPTTSTHPGERPSGVVSGVVRRRMWVSLGLGSLKRLLPSNGGYLLAKMLRRHMLPRLMYRHASAAEETGRVRTGRRRVARLLNGMHFSKVLYIVALHCKFHVIMRH